MRYLILRSHYMFHLPQSKSSPSTADAAHWFHEDWRPWAHAESIGIPVKETNVKNHATPFLGENKHAPEFLQQRRNSNESAHPLPQKEHVIKVRGLHMNVFRGLFSHSRISRKNASLQSRTAESNLLLWGLPNYTSRCIMERRDAQCVAHRPQFIAERNVGERKTPQKGEAFPIPSLFHTKAQRWKTVEALHLRMWSSHGN